MVSQRTVLIITCIAAAYVVVVLGMVAVYPHIAPSWMFDGMKETTQQLANHMTAVNNYLLQVLW